MTAPAPPGTELTQILINSQSPHQETRRGAEQKLRAAEETNFAAYLAELSQELSSESRPSVARQLAGLVLKNAISGTDPVIDKSKREKWIHVPDDVRNGIKELVLGTLQSPNEEARSSACQVISKVGRLDLTLNKWPQLLPALMQFGTSTEAPQAQRRAAVIALGYLCEDVSLLGEELGVNLLHLDQRNAIITAVSHAMRDADAEVVLAGCKAFYHGLLFASENMAIATERDFIFRLIGQCLNHQDLRIQHASWECVLQLATEYYDYLEGYVEDIGKLSIKTVQDATALMERDVPADTKRQTEAVALAALEFWNTLCDVEIVIAMDQEQTKPSKHYIRRARQVLLPVLFEAMAKQGSEEVDADEWTLAMAAGTCVGLCAQVLGDEILGPALEFVNANFANLNWRRREAAVLAYGSIMEGPSSNKLEPLVEQSFNHLCRALADESVAVRDTTAWTVGRIASYHVQCVLPLLGTPTQGGLMNLLLEKLTDEPRVAAFVCYAIHEIARNLHAVIGGKAGTTPLDPFFRQLATALLHTAQRPDAAESNLRASAFEALSEVIEVVGGPECYTLMEAVLQELLNVLERSFTLPASEELFQLQGLICGCLNNILDRLGKKQTTTTPTLDQAGALFRILIAVIEAGLTGAVAGTDAAATPAAGTPGGAEGLGSSEERTSVGCEEDAMLAIGTLIRSFPNSVEASVPLLTQTLAKGLQNPHDVRFCRACIGVVCELASVLDTLSPAVEPYMHQVLPLLYRILQDTSAPISLKPPLIATIGDIAVGMGAKFEQFLEPFLRLLDHAASTKLTDGPVRATCVVMVHPAAE